MLTSTAIRFSRTQLLATSTPFSTSAATKAFSLCELFGTSLRLSSTSSSSSLRAPHHHKLVVSDHPSWLQSNHKILATQKDSLLENGKRYHSSKSSGRADEEPTPAAPALTGNQQHETWVEFQKSISVSGFETGQTTKVTTRTKKRGGKIDRKRREREEELEAALKGKTFDITTLKGGEFPPLRYSDEETARLLEEAYANMPVRTGKRGTLHLKREKRRWWIKRMYDAKKKHERMAEHERRMAKRHNISKWCYEIKTGAEEVREKERLYQMDVLERWAEMNGYVKGEDGLIEQNE
ncbi:hypothetical protein HJC23_012076 [Cyclotella cryptica]|uniref:Mitochondrial mRNA-processing protein COX24 C-terminal domain-containing protein n=1 Tax=Cyclotella cryptica TaxID=29204 RepID=A0ABD3PV34_9STRA|eukprot:CCRYP_011691-RA/>CCRYP_011691-RA protein AED:0.00 eAED:0.00 QI:147/-1/1/1/-1/1/1/112/294